jgi:hypothetical protein
MTDSLVLLVLVHQELLVLVLVLLGP